MAEDLSKYSDNELLGMFRRGDQLAGGQLAERYAPLVKRCTRPFFLVGGSQEDLMQEGMIGLVCSIQSYDPQGAASFKSYAELCIRRRIMDAVRAAGRNKHLPLNQRLSLDELYSDKSDGELPYDELYKLSPEELLLEQEKKSSFYALCREILSPLEKKVLVFYLEGLSYEEIAQSCEKPVKSVDSALQRIKKKLAAKMK